MDRFKGAENAHEERGVHAAPVDGFNEFISGSYFTGGYGHFDQSSVAQLPTDESLNPANSYHNNPRPTNQSGHVGHYRSQQQPGHAFQPPQQSSWQPQDKTHDIQATGNFRRHSHDQADTGNFSPDSHRQPAGNFISDPQQQASGNFSSDTQCPSTGNFSSDPFHNIWSVNSSGGVMADANLGQKLLKPGGWLQAPHNINSHRFQQMPRCEEPAYSGFKHRVRTRSEGPTSTPVSQYSWSTSDGVTDSNVSSLNDLTWDQSMYSTVQYPNMQMPAGQSEMNVLNGQREVNEWELQSEELKQRRLEAEMTSRQERRHWKKDGLHYPEQPERSGFRNQKLPAKEMTQGGNVVASFLERYRGQEMPAFDSESSLESNDDTQTPDVYRQSNLDAAVETNSNVATQIGQVDGMRSHLLADESPNALYNGDSVACETFSNPISHRNGAEYDHAVEATSVSRDNSFATQGSRKPVQGMLDCVDCSESREARSHSDPVTVQETLDVKNTKIAPLSKKPLNNNGKIRPGKRKPKPSRDKRRYASARTDLPSDHSQQNTQPLSEETSSNKVRHVCEESHLSSTKTDTSQDDCIQHEPLLKHDVPCASADSAIQSPSTAGNEVETEDHPESPSSVNSLECAHESDLCAMCDTAGCDSLCGCNGSLWIPVKESLSDTTEPVTITNDVSPLGNVQPSSEDDDQSIEDPCLASPPVSKEDNRSQQLDDPDEDMKLKDINSTTSVCEDKKKSDYRVKSLDQKEKSEGRDTEVDRHFNSQTQHEHSQPSKPADKSPKTKDVKEKGYVSPMFEENVSQNRNETCQLKDNSFSSKGNGHGKNEIFFDPRRIFGGHTNVKKTPEPAPKGIPLRDKPRLDEKEGAHVGAPARNIKESISMKPEKKVQHDVPVRMSPKADHTKSMNGSLLNKKTDQHLDHHVPFQTTDSLTIPPATEDSLGPEEETSFLSPKITQAYMYSFKRDEKTGTLKSSTELDEEHSNSNKDRSGKKSHLDEKRGERRCSGESHMDGFHHPFGCSAQCYNKKRSSCSSPTSAGQMPRPSSPSASSNEVPKEGKVPKTSFQQTDRNTQKPSAGTSFPQSSGTSFPQSSGTSFPQSSKESLGTSKLQSDGHSHRPDTGRKHTQNSREGTSTSNVPQEEETPILDEGQEMPTRGTEPMSRPRRPTRATYSKSRVHRTGEDEESRPRQSRDKKQSARSHPSTKSEASSSGARKEGQSSGTSANRRPSPDAERRHQAASDEDTSDRSDAEDELAVDTDWWIKVGKKIGKGVYWLLLFTLLLCLVLLSFILAILKDASKFAYRKGRELWASYWGETPSSDGYFTREDGGGDADSGGSRWWRRGQEGQSRHGQPDRPRRQKQRVKRTQNIELPITEDEAIGRLLSCDPDDLYGVVGVAEDAREEEIKKYYRKQCMLVHPDKTKLPRANEAFQILQKAYGTLSDETKKHEYDMEINYKEEMEEKVEEFFKKMEEMANSMACGACSGTHKRYDTDLPLHSARYCGDHNSRHSVRDGALWKETANFGFKIYVYHCDGDKVYDVTEWAACQDLDWMEANTCKLQCRVKKGNKNSQQRQQSNQGYQHVFDNVFGSGAFRQFQAAAGHQNHQSNSSHGASGSGGGGARPGQGNSSKPSGSNRNQNSKLRKSRKKKK